MEIHGHLVDMHKREIYSALLTVENGRISSIKRDGHRGNYFILPGFVDAHIHIESSMIPPSEFAHVAVRHGTIATVCDPHEIANVLGGTGIEFMLKNARKTPLKFYFGAPSCVPATRFETSGAILGPKEVKTLLSHPEIKFLSEVMNYPGVLSRDPDVMAKIAAAKEFNKPVDGHAPGLHGEDIKNYIAAGISTDHESTTLSEAKEKRSLGMKILVREGSAAHNFNALFPLMKEDRDGCMFCSDDLHPENLLLGHINLLVKKAVKNGMDLLDVLCISSKNPVEHYKLDMGLLREGDPADFILVEDLKNFRVLETYIDGICVFKEETLFPRIEVSPINIFHVKPKSIEDFLIPAKEGDALVIEILDKELITKKLLCKPTIKNGYVISDPARDLLKITVVNRYKKTSPSVGLIKNFGLKQGAVASSIAHDCHNIIAIGASDEDLCTAINAVIAAKGGIAVTDKGKTNILPLPIAGLMSTLEAREVAHLYGDLEEKVKKLGSHLHAPLMTLSFMALLVIPELKISDLGLFDGNAFTLTSLFTERKTR